MTFPRHNKYKVAPKAERTWDGEAFASKAEMLYAQRLLADPEVAIYDREPDVLLDCIKYRPDFHVLYKNGSHLWIDVKGKQTQAFRIKLKLWSKYGPGTLRLVKYNGPRKFGHAWKVLGDYGPGLPPVKIKRRPKKIV